MPDAYVVVGCGRDPFGRYNGGDGLDPGRVPAGGVEAARTPPTLGQVEGPPGLQVPRPLRRMDASGDLHEPHPGLLVLQQDALLGGAATGLTPSGERLLPERYFEEWARFFDGERSSLAGAGRWFPPTSLIGDQAPAAPIYDLTD